MRDSVIQVLLVTVLYENDSVKFEFSSSQVVAVAGRSLERAKEFAARFSVAKAYGSYEELAQDNDVDIVYVGTINSAHYDCCMKMFEYNKHVLCEKPLTLNAIQTKQLIETARSKKLFFMEVI